MKLQEGKFCATFLRNVTNPEGHLNVLATPDLHFVVVGADFNKVSFGNGEQTTGKGWCSEEKRNENRVKILYLITLKERERKKTLLH